MRLIDVDAFGGIVKEGGMIDEHATVVARNAMLAMPTVDAVPVRHGKWIHEVRYTIDSLHSYQQYRCSECGMTYITNTKYCPNCGARMEEE